MWVFADKRQREREHVPIWLFVPSCLCLCFFILALGGLGLSLGIGCRLFLHRSVAALSSPSSSAKASFPANLLSVDPFNLIHHAELDLSPSRPRPFAFTDAPTAREYTFNITQALAAPDGFQKPMILANGQSPGPLIEAATGDTVRVRVNNHMAHASTSIHWHGINQVNSSWMDGVAAVSQCGIPPGGSFVYEFVVTGQRGTFWWHGHLANQYTDGLYGPLLVRDKGELVQGYEEEKVLFVGDLYHADGSMLLKSYLNSTSIWVPGESGVEPLPDNIVLNGKHTYPCNIKSSTYTPKTEGNASCTSLSPQEGLYHVPITRNKTSRLRLINSSSFFSYWISIDSHTMTLVELDGVEIEPMLGFRGVYLNIGQRASVLVTADAETAGNYRIRATLPKTCFLPYVPYNSTGLEAVGFEGVAVLEYVEPREQQRGRGHGKEGRVIQKHKGDVNSTNPDSTQNTDGDVHFLGTRGNTTNPYGVENNGARGKVWEGCDDMPFHVPKPRRAMDAFEVDERNVHYVEYMFRQAQDVNRIFVNKTAYAPLPHNATLWKTLEESFDPKDDNSYGSWDFGLDQQVLLVPEAEKGAQIVINSRDAMEHPWHLHGHTFQVVGWGLGLFGEHPNGTTWNLQNPMRRDTVTVPAQSHVVLRFKADNPGVWALHCHVAWHVEGGMLVTFAERPRDLAALVRDKIDLAMRETCMGFCAAESAGASDEYGETVAELLLGSGGEIGEETDNVDVDGDVDDEKESRPQPPTPQNSDPEGRKPVKDDTQRPSVQLS